jgi:hypothetical protein
MEQDELVRAKIDDYAMHYEDQRGPIFSNKLALQNIEAKSPRKSISIMYVCVAV